MTARRVRADATPIESGERSLTRPPSPSTPPVSFHRDG